MACGEIGVKIPCFCGVDIRFNGFLGRLRDEIRVA